MTYTVSEANQNGFKFSVEVKGAQSNLARALGNKKGRTYFQRFKGEGFSSDAWIE